MKLSKKYTVVCEHHIERPTAQGVLLGRRFCLLWCARSGSVPAGGNHFATLAGVNLILESRSLLLDLAEAVFDGVVCSTEVHSNLLVVDLS